MWLELLALGLQRGALAHAESVLLVDDRQSQAAEDDPAADHRVRPDHNVDVARFDCIVDRSLAGGREAPGQELTADTERLEQGRQPQVVLTGEDLGRRHQSSLPSGSRHGGQGDRCDGGLAAPDVPLHEASHRQLASQVDGHLPDRLMLVPVWSAAHRDIRKSFQLSMQKFPRRVGIKSVTHSRPL